MRISYVCAATAWGGAEIFLANLLAALGPEVEATVLGVDSGVLARLAGSRPGTPTVLMPRIHSKRDLRAIAAQRRALARTEPEVVQINLPVPFAEPWTVLAAASLRSCAVIVVEHLPMAIPGRGMRLLKYLTEPLISAHVAVGEQVARRVEAMVRRPRGAVRVIHNGVPSPVHAEPAARSGPEMVVLGIGRLHPQKGFDLLLAALAGAPRIHLVLVGDGPERTRLESEAARLGVAERVQMMGWISEPGSLLSDADLLALPSRDEGLPLVLLEAMHAGVPVVAADVGSVREAVLEGSTGLIVPPEDVGALTRALIAMRDDPEWRGRLGRAGAERADRLFTAGAMARAYLRMYAELAPDR